MFSSTTQILSLPAASSILLIILAVFTDVSRAAQGCPERDFLSCVLRLRAQRVPFDKNILNVVFNVSSEAKMLHTCRAYSDVMPCFRDRIVVCGDDKQRRMLDEVGKMLMFLCSPFSMDRQRQLMEYSTCIGNILMMPATTGCDHSDHPLGAKLAQCREACGPKQDFICLMRTWVSEQSVCTAIDIEKKCGHDAAHFYNDLQRTVFEPRFPLICDTSPTTDNSTSTNEISTLIPPLVYTVTAVPVDPPVETNTLNLSQFIEAGAKNFWNLKNIGLVTATALPPTLSTDPTTSLTPSAPSVHENFYNRGKIMSTTLAPFPAMTAETFWPHQRETAGPVMHPTRFDPWTRRYPTTTTTETPNVLFPLPGPFPSAGIAYLGGPQHYTPKTTSPSGPIGVRESFFTSSTETTTPFPTGPWTWPTKSPRLPWNWPSTTTTTPWTWPAPTTTPATTTTTSTTTPATTTTTTIQTTSITPTSFIVYSSYQPYTRRPHVPTTTWRPWYLGGLEQNGGSNNKQSSAFKPDWPFQSPRVVV